MGTRLDSSVRNTAKGSPLQGDTPSPQLHGNSPQLHAIVLADPSADDAFEQANARLDQLLEQLRLPTPPRKLLDLAAPVDTDLDYRASFTREDYERAVDTIKEYILAGDCMQVVPSQRMSIDFKAEPIDLYRALRSQNPTPYMYFFNFGDFHVVGSSPEVLVRVEEGEVTVRPIAGTRPRGATGCRTRCPTCRCSTWAPRT